MFVCNVYTNNFPHLDMATGCCHHHLGTRKQTVLGDLREGADADNGNGKEILKIRKLNPPQRKRDI